MAETLWKRATESLPRRAVICFAACAAFLILGQLAAKPVSGVAFLPNWLKAWLYYAWLVVVCSFAAGLATSQLWNSGSNRGVSVGLRSAASG